LSVTRCASRTASKGKGPRLGRAIADGIASARFVEFINAGHALPIQCAGRFNDLAIQHFTASGG
jgi:hypothetical protein